MDASAYSSFGRSDEPRARRVAFASAVGPWQEASKCAPGTSTTKEGWTVKVFQHERQLRTSGGLSVRDITDDVVEAVRASGVSDGIACVYSPHTTCCRGARHASRISGGDCSIGSTGWSYTASGDARRWPSSESKLA